MTNLSQILVKQFLSEMQSCLEMSRILRFKFLKENDSWKCNVYMDVFELNQVETIIEMSNKPATGGEQKTGFIYGFTI